MLIKICGMTRQVDLDLASRAGVDFCGFIFAPKSPRYIAPEKAAELNSHSMKRVGVFTGDDPAEILEIMNLANLDFAQLHGAQNVETAKAIGKNRVIRVLWPEACETLNEMRAYAGKFKDACAWFLLDAGREGGGSGKGLLWSELRNPGLPGPWFLAGGLNNENAREALGQCSPNGLDFNSGLEDAPGIKNADRIREIGKLKLDAAF